MASLPSPERCFADEPLVAQDVARGLARLFCRQDLFGICEVPLPNGRRADMVALCPRGLLTIVEIKVSRADLLGDQKWPDYLDYCDRFFWAVPTRSEEHTSELPSLMRNSYAVFCLKKKNIPNQTHLQHTTH